MTEDLAQKLKTAGAFDSPWLKEQLLNWDHEEEQRKADFMEHMYHCAGRQDPSHPKHSLYTGLWQDFCVKEAGPVMRNYYFQMLAAVEIYEKAKAEQNKAEEVIVS